MKGPFQCKIPSSIGVLGTDKKDLVRSFLDLDMALLIELSVINPTFNNGPKLTRALQSVFLHL